MGRRPETARFMPGVYVFPGGAVDESDFAVQSDRVLADDVLARLRRQARQPLAHALAWAAIRETWEETGLLLGAAGSVRARPIARPCKPSPRPGSPRTSRRSTT